MMTGQPIFLMPPGLDTPIEKVKHASIRAHCREMIWDTLLSEKTRSDHVTRPHFIGKNPEKRTGLV